MNFPTWFHLGRRAYVCFLEERVSSMVWTFFHNNFSRHQLELCSCLFHFFYLRFPRSLQGRWVNRWSLREVLAKNSHHTLDIELRQVLTPLGVTLSESTSFMAFSSRSEYRLKNRVDDLVFVMVWFSSQRSKVRRISLDKLNHMYFSAYQAIFLLDTSSSLRFGLNPSGTLRTAPLVQSRKRWKARRSLNSSLEYLYHSSAPHYCRRMKRIEALDIKTLWKRVELDISSNIQTMPSTCNKAASIKIVDVLNDFEEKTSLMIAHSNYPDSTESGIVCSTRFLPSESLRYKGGKAASKRENPRPRIIERTKTSEK